MDVRSRQRKISFDLLADARLLEEIVGDDDVDGFLSRSISVPDPTAGAKKRRRKRRNKKAAECQLLEQSIPDVEESVDESVITEHGELRLNGDVDIAAVPLSLNEGSRCDENECRVELNGMDSHEPRALCFESSGIVGTFCVEVDSERSAVSIFSSPELRQRTATGAAGIHVHASLESNQLESDGNIDRVEVDSVKSALMDKRKQMIDGNAKLEGEKSLDWRTLTTDESAYQLPMLESPLQYFHGEIKGGNSLRITTSVGNDKKRQRVYNTMFHVPWRCELLIDVGLFVCLDSFLSLLTVMPARIMMTFWRFLRVRQFLNLSAEELSDFGCLLILTIGVTLLQGTDISLIYHIIRGQGTIKLYVVYNVLEIFDKLCQSFGCDVLQVLFNSAVGLASSTRENVPFELLRLILDQTIAIAAIILHSFVLLAQGITLSTCIVAHNNALLALLVSNNFAEIKSNVFKRFNKENLHKLAYYDTVERFHIAAYILFVLAQNILEAEGSWFGSFLTNAVLVYACEVLIDIIKHSFLAKFNEIKPEAYSEFLEDLCKQTLNTEPEDGRKNLNFVPLAPACVVIRVLTPIYSVYLPNGGPVWWRLFWICLLASTTYIMLVILKVIVGMGLRLHAVWYINRRLRKKHHLHSD